MTGGSLEESKEALAIAETDGLQFPCFLFLFFGYTDLVSLLVLFYGTGRLFCTVGVHPTRCMVAY